LSISPKPETAIGRAIAGRTIVHIPDVQADPDYSPLELARASNMRCIVAVPMLRKDKPVGGIVVWRSIAEPFTEKQIELLKTFANLAMLAIEEVRLYRETNRQLAIIREVFGKYVPESVVEAIVSGKGHLKPIQTTATVMYSDLEAFMSIVEDMPPIQVVQMLNEYFPAVIEPINRHGGVVNQFQGDAMLVTFNIPVEDPHHADEAVKTACEIQEVVKNRTFAGVSLRTRIGINTGTVIAGNVGSGDRVNYTVHGDAVNQAARLEQLNKVHGTLVLVSGSTVSLLTDTYPLEPVGEVIIRGKHESVELFKLAI
jgi:class 3 adenylate cyclase